MGSVWPLLLLGAIGAAAAGAEAYTPFSVLHFDCTSYRRQDGRLWANLRSCACLNPEYENRYYEDNQVELVLESVVTALADARLKKALRRLSVKPLSRVFVLKADWFRLAVLFLHGGWWLDGDVRCVDRMEEELRSRALQDAVAAALEPGGRVGAGACLLAWEGELSQPASAPLNWALGCPPRHPFLQLAMEELAGRVVDLKLREEQDLFAARVETRLGWRYVDVLRTTGPAMVGEALARFAGQDLREVRRSFGEREDDSSTWDAVSAIFPANAERDVAPVVVLPYCFFRSRGCAHLAARFGDRVLFHHEFDTSWRPSFWHNYVQETVEL